MREEKFYFGNENEEKKIYAITYTTWVDDFSRDGYTVEIYDAFFSTRELAEKANKEKFFGMHKIKEITLDVVIKQYAVEIGEDDDEDDDWDYEDEDE